MISKIEYPELKITIDSQASRRDTTEDLVHFEDFSGRTWSIDNSLQHQPAGIQTTAINLGIKQTKRVDFTIVKLPRPAPFAAMFTNCRCPSYTVVRNRQVLRGGVAHALAVNSGNANVYTPTGESDLNYCVELVAKEFDIAADKIVFCSTGVIGVRLPVAPFEKGIPGLSQKLSGDSLDQAAVAILTTDMGPKTASFRFGDLVVCGIAKGAGMIEPQMATMLVYFFTNAKLSGEKLQEILEFAVRPSFNSISIDSDTSTSDSVALFSTGELAVDSEQESVLADALRAMSVKLARDIVSQGEGVTKLVECTVGGVESDVVAKRLAKKIINSPLVKTAVHGADPNWGRVVAALGKPDGEIVEPLFDESKVEISMARTPVFGGKAPVVPDLAAVRTVMQQERVIEISVVVGSGSGFARVWGCDLTEEYVTYNSDYTS